MVAPPAPVAVVVDFSRVKVSFNAPEVDASYFTLNRKITLNVDALPGQKFYANITEVSPVIDPMTRTVSIKALAENPKRLLKPGMTARITMVMAERKDVVAVPKDAIIGDFIYVVKADSMTEKRIVTLGLSGDEMTEITMGLDENEMVVVLGQQRLAGNEKVNPIERQ
jgi:RND family efflux transporter MFP subunit